MLRGLLLFVLSVAEVVYGKSMRFNGSPASQSDEIADTFYDTVPTHDRHKTPHNSNPYPHDRQISNVSIYKNYKKECNSYYGRAICYHVYTNNSVVLPEWWTCWNIAPNTRNCTEIDNLIYLKNQGFKAWDVEIDNQNFRKHKFHSGPIFVEVSDKIFNGEEKYYDPYRPVGSQEGGQRLYDKIFNGNEKYYDPYRSSGSQEGGQGVDDKVFNGDEKYYDPHRPAGGHQAENDGENGLKREREFDEKPLTRGYRRGRRLNNLNSRLSDE